jgi:hypothetical protein
VQTTLAYVGPLVLVRRDPGIASHSRCMGHAPYTPQTSPSSERASSSPLIVATGRNYCRLLAIVGYLWLPTRGAPSRASRADGWLVHMCAPQQSPAAMPAARGKVGREWCCAGTCHSIRRLQWVGWFDPKLEPVVPFQNSRGRYPDAG